MTRQLHKFSHTYLSVQNCGDGKLNLMDEAWPRHLPLSFQSELLPIVADWSYIDQFHCTEFRLELQPLLWRRQTILNFFWRAGGSRCGGLIEVWGVRIANLFKAFCCIKLEIRLRCSNARRFQFHKPHDSCKLLHPFSLFWHFAQGWILYSNIGGSQGGLYVLCDRVLFDKDPFDCRCFWSDKDLLDVLILQM